MSEDLRTALKCNISKQDLVTEYKDVFTGAGEFHNKPCHITLKNDAILVIQSPDTLDKLEKGRDCV